MEDGDPLWAQLLEDLESQWDAGEAAQTRDDTDELVRADRLAGRLLDRLRGACGRRVAVAVAGLGALEGTLADCGPDWVLITTGGRSVVVALPAVTWLRGVGAATVPDPLVPALQRRWRLTLLLARLARLRQPVTLVLVDGSRLSGTLARVGADYVELAEHPTGERARPDAVSGSRLVALGALAAVAFGP